MYVCVELQWREWTLQDLSLLIVSAMQATPLPAPFFTLACQYFDCSEAVNPLLSWMSFYKQFHCKSDYDECARALNEFTMHRDKVSTSVRVCNV